jgi:AICAR transformylase/IMP cyclohydrolase PurH
VKNSNQKVESRSFFGGTLIQNSNNKNSSVKNINGINKLSSEKINFFVNVLKSIKSNAIAVFDESSLISQSGGQTSRVDALQNCLYKFKIKHKSKKFQKIYLFSDAFFPFTDSLLLIKKQKIKIEIYAPMGSNNDLNILKEIKRYKLNFFKLSDRHFKH